ncbi:MAG: deaminase [Patescibacteria group bacterium]|nr:deaminase [Patescibacteria group bacterium]
MVIIGTFAIIHKGYLDILDKYPKADIFVLSDDLAKELYKLEIDLRKMPFARVQKLLENLGRNVLELNKSNLDQIKKADQIILITDDVINEFKKKYLKDNKNLILENGFFYHPSEKVFKIEEKKEEANAVIAEEDKKIMKLAIEEARESGCFWRQIASIVVKNGKILYKAFNQMLPNNDECYKIGCIRDNLKPGEKTAELCSAVHSEASCIAQAARDGVSLQGTSIYVTTFPCPMCAKLIATCGIKKCFYNQGWANFDGERILKAAGVELIKVDV